MLRKNESGRDGTAGREDRTGHDMTCQGEKGGSRGGRIMLTRRASGLHDRTASTISSKSLYITLSHPSTAAT